MDMVEVAIKRLQTFEPEEGYFLAFSGGKDSVVVKTLADMANVKYDAHYAITSVDPPELVQFVKTFPDVIRERQYWKKDGLYHKKGDPITMWNLIPEKKMPPTRIARYCCAYLKESQGEGRFVVTGVRKAESARRAKTRGGGWKQRKRSRNGEIYMTPITLHPKCSIIARFIQGEYLIRYMIGLQKKFGNLSKSTMCRIANCTTKDVQGLVV